MSGGYARKAEDVSRKLSETLGRLYSQLAGPGSAGRREGGEDAKTTDGGIDRESLTDAVGEVRTHCGHAVVAFSVPIIIGNIDKYAIIMAQ